MLRRRFASSSCFFDCSLRLRLATMEVDSEIARVQSQIDKVEKDIELVESECRTALTSEDKQYLREKEKALRAEKNALRAEKNALREKENKLLEKENKLLDLQLKNADDWRPKRQKLGRAKKRYKPGTEFKDFAANAVGLNRTPDMKFWEVAADPLHNFKGPFLIWNRKSYDHLTEIIEGHLNNSTYERFIILGTAGIGKSLFTLLWVMKLAAKECRVVYKYGSMHHILDFTNKTKPEVTGPFDEGSLELQESLDDTSTWLVIDGKQEGGLRYRCKMLVACCTKPGNYEEFGKNLLACKLYLPAWSMEEVESFMNDFEAHRASYPEMKVMTDKEAVLKHFEVIGGIPRYVLMHGKFEEGKHRVDAAVNAVSTNSERLFSLLSGVYDQSLSDCIVHIFVKDDCCTRWYEFASGYVQDALAESFEKASRLDVVSFLAKHYSNSELATFWGKLYEERVHQMLLAGGAFKIKRVYEGGGEDPEEQLDIPPKHFVRFNGIQQLQVHPAGTYLRPTSRTFQSIDGILCPNKLIQAFKRVNNNHGFKAHGLEVVDNQLKQSEYELYSCVPPEQFETTKFQNYLNKEGSVFHGTRRATMNVLDKCVQFVLEVGYRELHI